MIEDFIHDDGGRAAAGYKGKTGDCVVRSIAIVTGLPYRMVYEDLSDGCRTQRVTRRGKRKESARNGVNTNRKWFKDYMCKQGFVWIPTMKIGSGCRVHLHASELPAGRLVVQVSRHLTAMIDGIIHDTWDPRREVHRVGPDHGQALKPGQWRKPNGICSIERRCVYGYWILQR